MDPAAIPCMCAALRRASRAVTRRYDDALRPAGLHTTQFTTLLTLAKAGPMPQRRLAEILLADQTTLSRTLAPLEASRWIVAEPGRDRRERVWSLSPTGRRQLERAMPAWQRAQDELKRELRAERVDRTWDELLRTLSSLGSAAA